MWKHPHFLQENGGDATHVMSHGRCVRGGWSGGGRSFERRHGSLRQRQEDVFHQHGADHHFLAVDRELGGPFLFGHHADQHQAAAGHRPAGEPVDRMVRRRRRRRKTEVKAAKIRSEGEATEQRWDTRFNETVLTFK